MFKIIKDISEIDPDISYVIHLAGTPDNRNHASEPIKVIIDLFQGIVEGGIEDKTDTYKELMGEQPKSLEEYIKEHAFIFNSQ